VYHRSSAAIRSDAASRHARASASAADSLACSCERSSVSADAASAASARASSASAAPIAPYVIACMLLTHMGTVCHAPMDTAIILRARYSTGKLLEGRQRPAVNKQ